MEDFKELSKGVLDIQILKEQTETLNTYKKSALEELGTIVYTNISQGLSEDKKVKETCDLIKTIDNQMKGKEGEILRLSDKIQESILGLKPISPCDCGTELYEGIKFCYQCGKKVVENVNGEGEKEEKKCAVKRACIQCGNQLPKDLNFCTHCGVYTDPDLLAPTDVPEPSSTDAK
jgi:Double zinc ribbon